MVISRKVVSHLCLTVAAALVILLVLGWKYDFHPWNASITEKIQKGSPWQHDDFLACYLWWAGVLNVGFFLFLGLTTRLWYRENSGGLLPKGIQPTLRHWWFAALFSTGLAASNCVPRLDHSLWDDEQHTMLEFVHGQWTRDADDSGNITQFFGQVSWWDTVIGYREPNNHILFSITSRCSLSLWRWWYGKASYEFSEVFYRLPAIMAGLLAIAAWGRLARLLGLRLGAALLMLLLSVHPWFVRYASEGRGYAFVLLGFPLLLSAWLLALRSGKWRWWLAGSLLQVFLLLSWPGMGMALVAVNLGIAVLILRRNTIQRWPAFFSWGAANLISIGLFLQWFLPCIMQERASDFDYPQGVMGGRYVMNLIAHLTTGTVWSAAKFDPDSSTVFLPLGEQVGWRVGCSGLVIVGVLALAIWGLVQIWKRDEPSFLKHVWTSCFLSAAAFVGAAIWASQQGKFMFVFDWYFVWLMPVMLVLVSAALETLPARWAWFAVAVFGLHAIPSLNRLREFPVEPMRESCLAVRQTTTVDSQDRATILTAHVNQMASIYDPHCFEVTEWDVDYPGDPGLASLMKLAAAKQMPLFINVGFPRAARENYPEIMKVIDDPAMFESVMIFHGQELTLDHQIFRYRKSAGVK